MSHELFISKMEALSDKELLLVMQNHNQYSENAIEAATIVANNRKLDISDIIDNISELKKEKEEKTLEKLISKELKIKKLTPIVIGWFQIIAGAYLIISFYLLSSFSPNSSSIILTHIFGFLSLISGYLFLHQKKYGELLSYINFGIQILQIQVLGFGIKYFNLLTFGFDSDLSIHLNFSTKLGFTYGRFHFGDKFYFLINILPVIMVYFIYMRKQLLAQK